MVRENNLTGNSINHWYVITGAPSSGKTTILEKLEKKGFQIIYEAARIYIDQQIKKGKKLQQIRKNELKFQQEILKFKVKTETKLPRGEQFFFDRAIPDSIAYYKICGINYDSYLDKTVKNCFYKKVFLFQILEYKKDYSRVEDANKARVLEKLLEEAYTKLKFPIIKVPKMTIDKRVKFILDNL